MSEDLVVLYAVRPCEAQDPPRVAHVESVDRASFPTSLAESMTCCHIRGR